MQFTSNRVHLNPWKPLVMQNFTFSFWSFGLTMLQEVPSRVVFTIRPFKPEDTELVCTNVKITVRWFQWCLDHSKARKVPFWSEIAKITEYSYFFVLFDMLPDNYWRLILNRYRIGNLIKWGRFSIKFIDPIYVGTSKQFWSTFTSGMLKTWKWNVSRSEPI